MRIYRFYFILIFLYLSHIGSFAQNTLTFSGTTVGAPTAIFPNFGSTASTCGLNTSAEPYRIFTLNANTTTTLTVNITDPISVVMGTDDTGLFWYQTSVDPNAACTNFKAINNDPSGSNLTLAVTAGNTYKLAVVGIFGSADPFSLTVTGLDVVISVELLDFKGQNTEGGNLLTWTTANEVNNKGFQVERLTSNAEWLTLGFVTANGKASDYQFTDHNSLTTAYYRLRQIDNDGKETLSKVISIQTNGKLKVRVYPSITKGELTVEGASSFEVVNLIGQIVVKRNVQNLQDVVNLSNLTQGIYLVKGVDTEGMPFSQKIIKQ